MPLLTLCNCVIHRATPDVVKDLMLNGYVPSWCTACYRKGRTGEHFMKIAKAGNIHSFCHPNSILSLQVGREDVWLWASEIPPHKFNFRHWFCASIPLMHPTLRST